MNSLEGLAVATAIGLIVGLERGWRLREEPDGSRVAGLRTFGLVGLLGGASAATATAFASPAIFAVALGVFAAVFAWYHERESRHRNAFSVTSTIAGIAIFVLGGLAVADNPLTAAAGGVAVACILASREVLHRLLRRLSWPEVRSALLLAAMTALVLPVMPNRPLDPWGGLNLFEIWLFTVLTAAISFAGYVAIRIAGPGKGTIVASLLGALVSSTAVTIALGRRAKTEAPVARFAGGAALAAMVSALRVVLLVFLVSPAVAADMAAAAAVAAAVFGGAGVFLLRRHPDGTAAAAAGANPFDLGPILIFAASFAAVSVVSAFLIAQLGTASVIATSGIAAIVDVDVAALTAARLAPDPVPILTAAQAILVAIAANGSARVGAAFLVGPRAYGWLTAGVAATAIAAGAGVGVAFGPF